MRRFQIVKRATILRRNVLVVSALDEGNNSLLVDDNFSMEGWRCCFDNLYACKNQQVQSGDNEGKGRKRKQRMAGLERLSLVTDRNFLFQEVHVGASFLPRLRGCKNIPTTTQRAVEYIEKTILSLLCIFFSPRSDHSQ